MLFSIEKYADRNPKHLVAVEGRCTKKGCGKTLDIIMKPQDEHKFSVEVVPCKEHHPSYSCLLYFKGEDVSIDHSEFNNLFDPLCPSPSEEWKGGEDDG